MLRHQEWLLRGIKAQAHCYGSRLAGCFELSSVGFGSPIDAAKVQVLTGKGHAGAARATEGGECLSPGCHFQLKGLRDVSLLQK